MSVEQDLKDWASRAATKRRQQDGLNIIAQAEELRQRGNQSFKVMDFQGAERLYSESLEIHQTAECFTNRALARLRLLNFESAILDCGKALSIDARNVKAYARRGMALSKLGRHVEALADFKFAETLQPGDSGIRLEREREEAILAAEKSSGESENDCVEPHTIVTRVEEGINNKLRSPKVGSTPAQLTSEANASSSVLNKDNNLNDTVLQTILERFDQSAKLADNLPTSSVGFERLWREHKSKHENRHKLLFDVLHAGKLVEYLSSILDAKLLFELLEACESSEEAMTLLRCIEAIPTFGLAKMMLSRPQKDLILRKFPQPASLSSIGEILG